MPRPSRYNVRAIGVAAHADDRTVLRFFDDKPIRPHSRERIQGAIIALGLSHLLGAKFADPAADPELDR